MQWDLSGGKVWRVREGAGEKEEGALRAFAARGRGRERSDSDGDGRGEASGSGSGTGSGRAGESGDEASLTGLDRVGMCRATVELMLSRHCGGVLVCDPSGLAETSLVVGCLRRMTRSSFASVCLEVSPVRSLEEGSAAVVIETDGPR